MDPARRDNTRGTCSINIPKKGLKPSGKRLVLELQVLRIQQEVQNRL